ncbi:hypothetical protein BGX38DRAFT_1274798 [Terfezia claveryi]|nr:hypothetical protein BGX38DRAFT_1274798 [Terfezia claveryi]
MNALKGSLRSVSVALAVVGCLRWLGSQGVGDIIVRGQTMRMRVGRFIDGTLIELADSKNKDFLGQSLRGHVGIEINEKADQRASYESCLGPGRTATHGGVRAAFRAALIGPSGRRRCGPQKSWLHYIGKSGTGHAVAVTRQRMRGTSRSNAHDSDGKGALLLGSKKTWGELDMGRAGQGGVEEGRGEGL